MSQPVSGASQPGVPTPTGGDPAGQPGTGQSAPTSGQPALIDPTGQGQGGTGQPDGTGDLATLPDWAQKVIRDARADAAKARTGAKTQAADDARKELTAQFAKILGLDGGGQPVDPAVLTEQFQAAQADAWRSGVELAVYRMAGTVGADPARLLDSVRFLDALDPLVDVDPRSAEFGPQLEAIIRAQVEANPGYAANPAAGGSGNGTGLPRPDPSQGSRGAGPSLDSRIAEAQGKGDWRTVISLQNEKLNTAK